jgi:hypothetical protein
MLFAEGPPGCSEETYRRVAQGISAAKGTSVAEKVLEYWKSLEGSTKEGPDTYHPAVHGNSIMFTDAKRNIISHFGIIEALFAEAHSTSNFKLLNVSSQTFQENLQAVLLLKFNHSKFSLSAFHPNMDAHQKQASIKAMLGECENMDWQKKSYTILTDA